MTIITEMREAASMLPDSPVKKMLIWAELELGERADRIFELEEDETALYKEVDELRIELRRLKTLLEEAAKSITRALFEIPPPAVDLAPHQNIMAAHGVAPYAKTKRIKKDKS